VQASTIGVIEIAVALILFLWVVQDRIVVLRLATAAAGRMRGAAFIRQVTLFYQLRVGVDDARVGLITHKLIDLPYRYWARVP